MKKPTKKQREKLMKQANERTREEKDESIVKKVEVAIAVSQAIAVVMFILVLGKLCGM